MKRMVHQNRRRACHKAALWLWLAAIFEISLTTGAQAQISWQQSPLPFNSQQSNIPGTVLTLVFNANTGDILAGTELGGVYRLSKNATAWNSLNGGLTTPTALNVRALAINKSSNQIFAGTLGSGVFQLNDQTQTWVQINGSGSTRLTNLSINALAINYSSGQIYAGTANGGVFRRTSNDWNAINNDLGNMDVRSLIINSNNEVFAGTASGVFSLLNSGNKWEKVGTGGNNNLSEKRVRALALQCNGDIFAAAETSIFRLPGGDPGNSWVEVYSHTTIAIQALAINALGDIFAGLDGGGVILLQDNGGKKFEVNTDLTNKQIRSLAVNSDGEVFAGTAAIANPPNNNDRIFKTTKSTTQIVVANKTFAFAANKPKYTATDYQIIGLPGESNFFVNSDNFLKGNAGKDWQAYWDNGTALVKYQPQSLEFVFSVGRAFWIVKNGDLTLNNLEIPAAKFDTGAVKIMLHSGWNLITNPFSQTLLWSTVLAKNNLTGRPIWQFNGGTAFNSSNNLEPYVGYYFDNTPSPNLKSLKFPCDLLFSGASQSPIVDPATWRVAIALTSGEFGDKSNFFGVAAAASQALDPLDWRKPRAVAEMPTVSFSRPAWDAQFSIFATDIRPEFEESQSWDFDVRALPGVASQLAFNGLAKVPKHFDIFLIDESKARAINLREDSLYQFNPVAAMNKFTVVVGAKEAIKNQLDDLALPRSFTLGPNYPNPFWSGATSRFAGNPETTIPITIAAAGAVKLQIYNALGQTVKTLHDGVLEAGKYWFTWNGRDEADREVATGVYLYHLRTNTNVSLTQKMILLR